MPPAEATYSVITSGDPMSIAATARKALAQIDPALPLDELETYAQYMHDKLIGLAYVAVMLATDALIALLLADFIFGCDEFFHVRVAAVIVRIAPQRFPCGEILRIFRTRDGVRLGGLQGIARESVKFVVALAIRHDAWWM